MTEKAVQFGTFQSLVGVVSQPETPAAPDLPALIFANAGLIHRVGPNRIYVKLARLLAGQGYLGLRFDLSGVGDSLPRPDHMPVEQFTIDDLQQAMDYLSATYGSRRFVLVGHCAGAYHSFRTAAQDRRVCGAVMMNPDGGEAEWVDYDRKRKLAQYYGNYYAKTTLTDPQRWKRFFTGQVSYRSILQNLLRNVIWGRISGLIFRLKQRFAPAPPAQPAETLFSMEAILTKLPELELPVLLIYSEASTSLERIRLGMGKALRRLSAAGRLQLSVIPGADHIFTPLASQACLLRVTEQWLAQQWGTPPPPFQGEGEKI